MVQKKYGIRELF